MRPDPIGDAVEWVRSGDLLAYPTETVWGLGADSRSADALACLRDWKGRDVSDPVSILVESLDCLDSLGFELETRARKLAAAFWPGPLTLVLRCRGEFAPGIARDDGAVGVRCSSHPLCAAIARRLAQEGVGPITATSLNRRGATPAGSVAEARSVCSGGSGAPRLIDVERAEAGGDTASTVIDATRSEPRVLRWGALTHRDLDPVLPELTTR